MPFLRSDYNLSTNGKVLEDNLNKGNSEDEVNRLSADLQKTPSLREGIAKYISDFQTKFLKLRSLEPTLWDENRALSILKSTLKNRPELHWHYREAKACTDYYSMVKYLREQATVIENTLKQVVQRTVGTTRNASINHHYTVRMTRTTDYVLRISRQDHKLTTGRIYMLHIIRE